MKKREIYITIFLLAVLGYAACKRIGKRAENVSNQVKTTTALYETMPVPHTSREDAADDPAIWVNALDPVESRIIGTDKKGGLAVYNLKGEQLFYYPDGMMNNVDLRHHFIAGNDTIDIVCASNRSNQSIAIYKIGNGGSLIKIAARSITTQMQEEVYGLCMYRSPETGKYYVFMNSKGGEVEQWELLATDSLIDAQLVRNFKLGTQVEGMVADDENQALFISEEVKGIWKFNAEPGGNNEKKRLEKSSEYDNGNILFDIEGLSIYYLPDGNGYLLASIQGNYSYAVYQRKAPHKYMGSFRIAEGVIDGAEETDGLDIYSFALNDDFGHGLLVVQDGYNYDNNKLRPQNFKLVAWENVATLFKPALLTN